VRRPAPNVLALSHNPTRVTSAHPIRLVVSDDLQRSRLTVLFRLVLAIPHLIWALLWTIVVVAAVIANWFATLLAGRSPGALHRFLAAYLRYWTHLGAYLGLAANPYPGFTGRGAYPIDLEIDGPAPQRRLVTLVRIILAVPALLFAIAFAAGFPGGWGGPDAGWSASSMDGGITWTVAVLAWFAILAVGRMPLGFRNLQAYGLRFLAQAFAYLFVLTDRYPSLDPADPAGHGPLHPVRLAVSDDLRRSRLTVFFRLLLALPHFVWLLLWGIVALFALIAMWFATLFRIDSGDARFSTPPLSLFRFVTAFVRYSTHVQAFVALTANPFPGFTGAVGSYPIDPALPGPERQHRLVTLFRLFLAIPAFAVSGSLYVLAFLAGFFGWFVALFLGRMPRSLRDAQVYVLRYGLQVTAYFWLLTDRYPFSGPALAEPGPPGEPVETAVPA
jgi:Domain of unknown function (DUF4389)